MLGQNYRPAGLGSAGRRDYRAARRIDLRSGESLEHVRFWTNPVRRELLLFDARPRAIAWDEIENIIDDTGRNVTLKVLHRPRPNRPARDGKSGTAPGSPAQCGWPLLLELNAGLDVPAGDYYSAFSTGAGFGSVVRLGIGPSFGLRLSAERLGLGDGSGGFDPGFRVLSRQIDIDAWRYMLGFEYRRPMERLNPQLGFYAFHIAVGGQQISAHGFAVIDAPTVPAQLVLVTGSDRSFVGSAGLGAIRMLNAHWALTVTGDLNYTQYSYRGSFEELVDRGYLIGVRGGLAWGIAGRPR